MPVDEGGLTDEEHYANFQNVLRLLVPGRPERSRFLRKPLAESAGGLQHEGGDRIFPGDERYLAWTEFINGVEGPPLPSERPGGPPEVTPAGRTLQAEELLLDGDAAVARAEDAEGGRLVVAGASGGGVGAAFRLSAETVWRITFRLRGPGGDLRYRLDRRPPQGLIAPPEGFGDVGPKILLDGEEPLEGVSGLLRLEDGRLRMQGRNDQPASWLSPMTVDHDAVELSVAVPPEGEGGEDALLLFDMDDGLNGKFTGLTDGGRRFVIGVLEGGRLRVVSTAPAPPPLPDQALRTLRVDYLPGVAVARLDGKPLVFLHLDRHLTQGFFGARTHGRMDVERLSAFQDWEVHKVAFRLEPALRLPAGVHLLRVELPPGGAALDSITIREVER
jgi:hypothetical protein